VKRSPTRLSRAVSSTIDHHPDQSLMLSISCRLLLWSFSKLLRILSYRAGKIWSLSQDVHPRSCALGIMDFSRFLGRYNGLNTKGPQQPQIPNNAVNIYFVFKRCKDFFKLLQHLHCHCHCPRSRFHSLDVGECKGRLDTGKQHACN